MPKMGEFLLSHVSYLLLSSHHVGWFYASGKDSVQKLHIPGHTRHGGVEKRGGWKTSRMTPLPKRGFGPPLVRYVFHPPQVSVLCFSCTKIHDRADQKLFWRGPKIFGRARSLVRFPPAKVRTVCNGASPI